jgi:anhydro-N-acetylmuramic acid kinase
VSTEATVIIGLMSGTSADGVSAAAVQFQPSAERRAPALQLLAAKTIEYSPDQRQRLLRAIQGQPLDALCRLDFELGEWLADAASAVMVSARLRKGDVRAIASHGHTLWHAGPRGTWQIGESAVIAERTSVDVVSDFRARDVAAGGQGAPLVTIADAMLFASPDHTRALQNIGGIANVSIVPSLGSATPPRAFDTGPGCAVIDGVVSRLFPSLTHDADGALAARGRVIGSVLDHALADPYFAAPPPKSTGREHFSAAYVQEFLDRCRRSDTLVRPEDMIATATALTAQSIAIAYTRFIPEAIGDVLISGGGAKNSALVTALREALAPRVVRRFSEEFFDDSAKEAVAFAFLGWLFLERRPGNVPSATGAKGERILGKLTPAS